MSDVIIFSSFISIPNMLSDWFLKPTVERILGCRRNRGSVPELEGGIVEPWTHIECAMAIDAGDYQREAERAYDWLMETSYRMEAGMPIIRHGLPKDQYKVSHAISYIAVGVWHHYLVTGNNKFVNHAGRVFGRL